MTRSCQAGPVLQQGNCIWLSEDQLNDIVCECRAEAARQEKATRRERAAALHR